MSVLDVHGDPAIGIVYDLAMAISSMRRRSAEPRLKLVPISDTPLDAYRFVIGGGTLPISGCRTYSMEAAARTS
jgi:hypothetical protein